MPSVVQERLEKVFQQVFDEPSLHIEDATTANDIEEWDSLMHINLLIAIEQEFGVHFTTEEVMGLANVGQFIALLERKLAQATR